MPKKTSMKLAANEYLKAVAEIRGYLLVTNGLVEPYWSWTADHAVILLYREFEKMILTMLTAAINQDTATISGTTGIEFPKHMNKDVCQYLIVGDGYFDFKGRDGLIKILKGYMPDNHFLLAIVSDKTYSTPLDQLSALRNFATHDSSISKLKAYEATGNQKLVSAGRWLRAEGRFEALCESLDDLVRKLAKRAPY